ncbi:MAG TPA: hypothetical protein VF384_14930 [Planctomycetota bacterium]
MKRSLCVLIAGGTLVAAASSQTIVVPQQAVGVEGPSTTGYPWSPGTLATGSIRSQYFYTRNAFLNQSVTFPILITQLSWRANGAVTGGGSTFPSVEVKLSTATAGAITAPNATFATNHGPDVTTVFPSGPVTLLTVAGTTPNTHICTMTLATPFPYDPNVGDLCVDVSNQNATGIAGLASDLFNTLGADGARVWDWTPGSTAMTPTSGNNQPGLAIAMEIGYSPVSGTPATNTVLGQGCVRQFASFYENFSTSSSFDLANTAMTLIPSGSGYLGIQAGAFLPVGSVSAPVTLTLGDDAAVTQAFATGSFPGATGLTVCSNGFISLAPGNGTTYTPVVATLLNDPQTSFRSWHDFNPTLPGSGQVKWEESAAVVVVTWDGVWDYGGTSAADASTLQFQFYPSGEVVMAWGTMSTIGASGTGHLVGYSPGGPNGDPGNSDLSTIGTAPIVTASPDILPLALAASTRPVTGTNWNLTTSQIPANGVVGLDIFGLADPAVPDLAFLGMPGCQLRTTLDVMNAWIVTGATHNYSFAVPALPSLLNVHVFTQSAVFQVPSVNPFGAITSNGVGGKIGDI